MQAELESLRETARAAVDLARSEGADEAEVSVGLERGLSVSVRLGEVETLEHQQDRSLAITVYVQGRRGSASTADLGSDAVAKTVRKACSIAAHTARDEFAGLPEAQQLAHGILELDLHHPWALTPEEAIALARECEAAALAVDPAVLTNSEGASVQTGEGVRVLANTHGFCEGYPSSSHALSCAVLGRDGESMERDFWYTTARDPARLDAAAEVGREAARRTLRRLGARRPETCEIPVVFPPELARGLIGHAIGALSGGAQYRRSSFLLDSVGERVFPDWLRISERPHLPGAAGSAPFDAEGVTTRDRELVVDGCIGGYLLSSYSARKLGLTTTGNAGGAHNLVVHPSTDAGQDGLIAGLDRALVVTELMGQGVNPVTGDYSRGAAGLWVENGRVTGPVHGITIAGNLRRMYRELQAVGADADTRGVIRTGTIVLERMKIAGG